MSEKTQTVAAERATARLDWRAWLAGGSPREVLARIVQGDPLGVRARVARKLRAEARLLDADRVHLRALARCARAAPSYRGRPELDAWLDARVAEALRELLEEDDERDLDEADGEIPDASEEGAWIELSRPLELDAGALARACRAFNRRPDEERRAFFLIVLEGRSLDELARGEPGAGTVLARRARSALEEVLRHVPAAEGACDPTPTVAPPRTVGEPRERPRDPTGGPS